MNKPIFPLIFVLCWINLCFSCVVQSVAAPVIASAQQKELDFALSRAVKANNSTPVRALLRKGACANARSKGDDEAVLKVAARYASLDIVKMLLWRGANVNAKTGIYQGTALIYAAERGNAAIIQLLLRNGADVDAQDGQGWTALKSAKDNKQWGTVEMLKKAGAKIVR